MTASDAKQTIKTFLVNEGNMSEADTLEDDTNLLESGLVDSFGFLELITFLEHEYDITIDILDVDPQKLVIAGYLADLVVETVSQ